MFSINNNNVLPAVKGKILWLYYLLSTIISCLHVCQSLFNSRTIPNMRGFYKRQELYFLFRSYTIIQLNMTPEQEKMSKGDKYTMHMNCWMNNVRTSKSQSSLAYTFILELGSLQYRFRSPYRRHWYSRPDRKPAAKALQFSYVAIFWSFIECSTGWKTSFI